MDFHGNINLKDNEIQNLVFEQETSFPVDATLGSIVFKDNALYMAVALNIADPIWIPLTASIDTYVHEQEATSTTWTVTHNLGEENLILQVYNDANEMVIPDTVTPTDTNEIVVTFSVAIAGRVIVMFGDEIPANGIGIIDPAVGCVIPAISSMTYDSVSYNATAYMSTIRSFFISTDGTKLFILEPPTPSTSFVYQYTINSAWDLSSVSYDSIKYEIPNNAPSLQGQPAGLYFSNDGLRMFVSGTNAQVLTSYTLSSAWSLSSVSVDVGDLTVSGNTVDIFIDPTGLKLYTLGQVDLLIKQHTMSVAFDISTATEDGVTFNVGNVNPYGLTINPDGTQIFVTAFNEVVYQIDLSSAWDLSTASAASNKSIVSEMITPTAIHFNDDGTKAYISSHPTTVIHQYSTNI